MSVPVPSLATAMMVGLELLASLLFACITAVEMGNVKFQDRAIATLDGPDFTVRFLNHH